MVSRAFLFTAVIGATLAATGTPAYAASECNAFPEHALWGQYTHDKVIRYVDRRMEGDWDGYLARLDKQVSALSDIMRRGKTAVIRHRDKRTKLSGKNLAAYIEASKARYAVAQCLAAENDTLSLAEFATAAGTEEPEDQEIAPSAPAGAQLASVAGGALRLHVESACDDGDATFKVTNKGTDWPKLGAVAIYRMGAGKPVKISSRRMRFKAGQFASFKIKAGKNPTGQLGLFVKPDWATRPFAFDATLSCK